eukprot:evm.model.NODE_38705_length_16377_cov_19.994871.2
MSDDEEEEEEEEEVEEEDYGESSCSSSSFLTAARDAAIGSGHGGGATAHDCRVIVHIGKWGLGWEGRKRERKGTRNEAAGEWMEAMRGGHGANNGRCE